MPEGDRVALLQGIILVVRQLFYTGEMSAMWKVLFFKYSSVLLAFLGSALGLFIYLLHDYILTDHNVLTTYLLCLIVPACAGFISGSLIHNLHHSAHSDQLTNLWNSRYFYSQLTKQIEIMKKKKSSLCVAFIDLDDFKRINDTYGHVAGDEVLRKIATILVGSTRDGDIAVRWGGDEFAIIFPNTNIESASPIVERLRKMIENSSECRQVTISVGVVLVQGDMEVTQLFKMMDDTLYKAKKTKNLVVLDSYSKLLQI